MSRSYPVIPGGADQDTYGRCCDVRRVKDGPQNGWTACPICGEPARLDKTMVGEKITYWCGGSYFPSVDQDGNPAWTGKCGAPLKQKELVFAEEV